MDTTMPGQTALHKVLDTLKTHRVEALTLLCATLIILAALVMSPWITAPGAGGGGARQFQGNQQPSGDFAAQGGSAPAGMSGLFAMVGILPNLYLVVLAAAFIGGGAAIWRWLQPAQGRAARALIVLAGIIGALYYALVLGPVNGLLPIDITQMLNPGFWVGLVGVAGFWGQLAFQPKKDAYRQSEAVKALAQAGEGRLNFRSATTVSLGQNISVAFDSLLANKMRSGLTMLGVVIGVMAVVSLLSIGQGAQSSITDQITSAGTNLITVMGRGGAGSGLTEDDVEAIEQNISGLLDIVPEFSGSFDVKYEDTSTTNSVVGTTSNYAAANNLEADLGRFFDESEFDGKDRVVVLGYTAAEDLFGGLSPLGRTVKINNQRFEVIGVLEEQSGGMGQDPNTRVYVPMSTGYRLLFDARAVASTSQRVSTITLNAANSDDVEAIMTDVEELLREEHNLDTDEDSDFRVLSQQVLLETISSVTNTLTIFLAAIGGVSLIVGGIGIMNISLVSVTERTKEIGLRKAIGARPSQIMQQFLIETIVLSVTGGIIGVLSGAGLALLIDASGLMATTISALSIVLGLSFSLLIGVFFGVYPARRAASLQPIEALRYE